MVYKDFDLGSAKPNQETLARYPHHLVDICSPEKIYTASNFANDANILIKEAHNKNKIPLLVGGSMMYFQSILKGLDALPERDSIFRSQMKKIKESEGLSELFQQLKAKDPEYAKSIEENDIQRIIRALEIIHLSKKTLTSQLGIVSSNHFMNTHNVMQIGIFPKERKSLHERIDARLKDIINNGLVEETRKIVTSYDIESDHPALRAINYKQALSFINHEYDKETMYLKSLFATRQFAKRQITWMRSWENLRLFDVNEDNKVIKSIKNAKEIKSFV